MQEVHNWHNETIGLKVVEALKKNGFGALYFGTGEEARKFIMENINEGDKVGFGGSMTVKNLGIQEMVLEKGAVVLDHGDASLSPEEKMETMRGN